MAQQSNPTGRRTSVDLALFVALIVLAIVFVGPTAAFAFDPHEWGWDSDPGTPKTQFCLTNDGYGWNGTAVSRATDAIDRIEGDVPNFNLIIDRSLDGSCDLGDNRVEIQWSQCPAFAGQYIGLTWWKWSGGWIGTDYIAMIKWESCGDTSDGNLVKWDFNPNDGIGNLQIDFQEVLQHEIGHGLGLHHPEYAQIVQQRPGASTYDAMSFDGATGRILMRDATDAGERHVQLTQDDVSAFTWLDFVDPNTRRYLARPHEADYWGTFQGEVLEDTGYLVLTKDAGVPTSDYSYMYMTTRFTTDGRNTDRESPDFRVRWRKNNGQSQSSNDRLRLRVAWRPVYSNGSVGAWEYQYGSMTCQDNHADDTWEWCTESFNIGDYNVQDVRAYIYNSTVTRVHIDTIQFQDGGA